ncbi:DUF898 family protein [Chelatococcus sambhunathii]|uniref:DUF898 family protein n=1 Tax=Chelatococcus sambhunathii TaxID=363953 RepID=A0ABU1DDH9_9HYPH|nr:DUF898 family protein [Chelatococcus sambhunathii]MDR4306094.1 DUF898 family protein [Chelatococcus sambhunathii]
MDIPAVSDSSWTESVRPKFHGSARAMFPVVLKGLFLTIITLGIYRFWYMTNVRRFLWNNTEVDGDFLEYTGRGVELFIGFLIAVAVLVPFYAMLFLAPLYMGAEAAAVAQGLYGFALLLLAQYALYRARRYRLTRTIWRGVRFQQSGSGWGYAWRSLLWLILTVLTLGLAYPWMRAGLERYKMTNTWYGDQQGAFSATGGQLFWRTLLVWLAALVVIGGPIAFVAGMEATGNIGAASPAHALILVSVIGFIVLVPVYWAVEFRWWANGCSVGPAAAACDLGNFAFFKVYLGYLGVALLFGLVVGAIGLGIGFALHSGGVLEGMAAQARPPVVFFVAFGAFYFLVGLVFAALWQVFGVRPIWRKSFESCEIRGLGALMAAQSVTPEANAFGEGIADAIDFGGF